MGEPKIPNFYDLGISGRAPEPQNQYDFLCSNRGKVFWTFFGDRRHSKLNMQNRRFTSILATLAWLFMIFGGSKTL